MGRKTGVIVAVMVMILELFFSSVSYCSDVGGHSNENVLTLTNKKINSFYEEFYKFISDYSLSKEILINGTVDNKLDSIVRKNLSDRMSLPDVPYNLSYSNFDLNGDGINEIFVYVEGSGVCSRFGCLTAIFSVSRGNIKRIFEGNSGGDIYISPDGNHSYKTLFLTGGSVVKDEGVEFSLSVWSFDGDMYYEKKNYLVQKYIP